MPAADLAIGRGAEEGEGFEVARCIMNETLRVDGEVLEGFCMAFEFVEGFVGVEIPEDYGGVCAAGEEDGCLGEGGCEETFDEVGVGGKSLDFATGSGGVDGVDSLVPGSGVDCVIGPNGKAGQGCSSLGEDWGDLASLGESLST